MSGRGGRWGHKQTFWGPRRSSRGARASSGAQGGNVPTQQDAGKMKEGTGQSSSKQGEDSKQLAPQLPTRCGNDTGGESKVQIDQVPSNRSHSRQEAEAQAPSNGASKNDEGKQPASKDGGEKGHATQAQSAKEGDSKKNQKPSSGPKGAKNKDQMAQSMVRDDDKKEEKVTPASKGGNKKYQPTQAAAAAVVDGGKKEKGRERSSKWRKNKGRKTQQSQEVRDSGEQKQAAQIPKKSEENKGQAVQQVPPKVEGKKETKGHQAADKSEDRKNSNCQLAAVKGDGSKKTSSVNSTMKLEDKTASSGQVVSKGGDKNEATVQQSSTAKGEDKKSTAQLPAAKSKEKKGKIAQPPAKSQNKKTQKVDAPVTGEKQAEIQLTSKSIDKKVPIPDQLQAKGDDKKGQTAQASISNASANSVKGLMGSEDKKSAVKPSSEKSDENQSAGQMEAKEGQGRDLPTPPAEDEHKKENPGKDSATSAGARKQQTTQAAVAQGHDNKRLTWREGTRENNGSSRTDTRFRNRWRSSSRYDRNTNRRIKTDWEKPSYYVQSHNSHSWGNRHRRDNYSHFDDRSGGYRHPDERYDGRGRTFYPSSSNSNLGGSYAATQHSVNISSMYQQPSGFFGGLLGESHLWDVPPYSHPQQQYGGFEVYQQNFNYNSMQYGAQQMQAFGYGEVGYTASNSSQQANFPITDYQQPHQQTTAISQMEPQADMGHYAAVHHEVDVECNIVQAAGTETEGISEEPPYQQLINLMGVVYPGFTPQQPAEEPPSTPMPVPLAEEPSCTIPPPIEEPPVITPLPDAAEEASAACEEPLLLEEPYVEQTSITISDEDEEEMPDTLSLPEVFPGRKVGPAFGTPPPRDVRCDLWVSPTSSAITAIEAIMNPAEDSTWRAAATQYGDRFSFTEIRDMMDCRSILHEGYVLDESYLFSETEGSCPNSSSGTPPAPLSPFQADISDKIPPQEEWVDLSNWLGRSIADFIVENDPEHGKPKVLVPPHLTKIPMKHVIRLARMAKMLHIMYRIYRQRPDKCYSKLRMTEMVQDLFQQWSVPQPNVGNKPKVILVGSAVTGFGLNGSDADLCLVVSPHEVDQVRTAPSYLRGVISSMQQLYLDCRFTNITYVPARIPLVKFKDVFLDLDVDINCNNTVGMLNTRMLYAYAQLDWRVRPLMVIIKLWAHNNGINDPKMMTLSSYSLTLMAIHYLQIIEPPILPCIHKVDPDFFKRPSFDKKDVYDVDVQELLKSKKVENFLSIAELFVGFLDYYALKFDFEKDAISVREGSTLPISECRAKTASCGESSMWNYICIEEPFTFCNTASAVYDKYRFHMILKVFLASHKALAECFNLRCLMNGTLVPKILESEEFSNYSPMEIRRRTLNSQEASSDDGIDTFKSACQWIANSALKRRREDEELVADDDKLKEFLENIEEMKAEMDDEAAMAIKNGWEQQEQEKVDEEAWPAFEHTNSEPAWNVRGGEEGSWLFKAEMERRRIREQGSGHWKSQAKKRERKEDVHLKNQRDLAEKCPGADEMQQRELHEEEEDDIEEMDKKMRRAHLRTHRRLKEKKRGKASGEALVNDEDKEKKTREVGRCDQEDMTLHLGRIHEPMGQDEQMRANEFMGTEAHLKSDLNPDAASYEGPLLGEGRKYPEKEVNQESQDISPQDGDNAGSQG